MKKFKQFYFEKFSFDEKTLKAYFLYSFDNDEYFEEIVDFSNNLKLNKKLNKNIIDNFLFNIHIALGISYYKLFPTQKLIIKSGFLNNDQIDFWKKFYINGLGEFLIKNNIDPEKLFNFENTLLQNSPLNENRIDDINNIDYEIKSEKSLLMWGGGKDSIVSYSLIQNTNFDIFVVGKLDNIKKNTIKITGKNVTTVSRILSSNLFKLNESGYYNGHVPITGIIAFISLFFSYLYNYKYIIMSNEKSSSEENIIWKSIKINHQYSKSGNFEKDFRDYINKNISKNIKYFSILRGMYEYKIAEIFAYQKEFFNHFSSCNKNFKIKLENSLKNNWCCTCEKCCFVFLILSNFIPISELEKIFGKNLFIDKSLENIFIELIGFGNNKPFECVGTYEESLLSVSHSINKYKNQNFYILKKLEELLNNNKKNYDYEKIKNKLLKIYDDDIIPKEFKKKI